MASQQDQRWAGENGAVSEVVVHKHEDLSSHVGKEIIEEASDKHAHLWSQHWGSRHQRVPCVCCPASVAKSVQKDPISKIRWRVMEGEPLTSTSGLHKLVLTCVHAPTPRTSLPQHSLQKPGGGQFVCIVSLANCTLSSHN